MSAEGEEHQGADVPGPVWARPQAISSDPHPPEERGTAIPFNGQGVKVQRGQ